MMPKEKRPKTANAGSFKPGGKGGPGRPKGVPNKVTADIREMVRGALEDAGGREYLTLQAEVNPTAFMALIGKIIPKEIEAHVEPIEVRWSGERPRG